MTYIETIGDVEYKTEAFQFGIDEEPEWFKQSQVETITNGEAPPLYGIKYDDDGEAVYFQACDFGTWHRAYKGDFVYLDRNGVIWAESMKNFLSRYKKAED